MLPCELVFHSFPATCRFLFKSSSVLYGPFDRSSILCPFFVFCSILQRRTVSPFLKLQSKPRSLFRCCNFCFSWVALTVCSTFGKSTYLIVEILFICSWRTSAQLGPLPVFQFFYGLQQGFLQTFPPREANVGDHYTWGRMGCTWW